MWAWLVLVCVLGGCERMLGLAVVAPPLPDSATGSDAPAGIDSSTMTGDAGTSCVTVAALNDDFTGSTPCSPWASIVSSGPISASEGGGLLSITPAAATGSMAWCASGQIAFPANGVFVEVPMVPYPDGWGYTSLSVYDGAGHGAQFQMQMSTMELLSKSDTAGYTLRTYDPVAMRWWRLRPTTGGTAGEISADGVTWILFGVVADTPQNIYVELSSGAPGPGASSGSSQFAHFDTCP